MAKLAMIINNGYEEVEMLSVVDILRRAGLVCDIVSSTGELVTVSSHKVVITADKLIEDVKVDDYDGLIVPGGIPGTPNLAASKEVCDRLLEANEKGKLVAAVCAAPTVLGNLGILDGKKATCYPGMDKETSFPGMEKGLGGGSFTAGAVVRDGNVITSRGLGTSIDFGLTILEYFTDKATADEMAKKIVFFEERLY